jgi:glucose-6-phosphate-specific signal transduction histidine kinase
MTLNPEDKKKLEKAIQELSNSMTRVDAEKDLMKDIIQETHDSIGIDKKYIRKLATIWHKQNVNEVKTETDEVMELYEELFE